MHVNIRQTFLPGRPSRDSLAETHVMEARLYVLEGKSRGPADKDWGGSGKPAT